MTVFASVPDLMDRSRLRGVVERFLAAGAAPPDEVGARDVLVVDLSRPGALALAAEVAERGARVVGFGPHVDVELLQAARSAGVAVVLPRSRFFADPAAAIADDG